MSEPTSPPAPVAPHSDVLAHAARLEETAWSEAIDLLSAANRAERGDDVEIALVELRHRSYARLLAESVGGSYAEPGESPAIGSSGLPETTPGDLTAARVRAAILEHGSLLIKGAIDAERAERLSASIDCAFEARDVARANARQKTGPSPRPGAMARDAWFRRLALDPDAAESLGRRWIGGAGGLLLCDSPRAMFEILELYTELGLASLVTEYLGGRPVLSANKCTLRKVSPDATGGWHQDGAFLGRDIRAINLWLALTPCGIDAPGMDIVPHRFDDIVETGTGSSNFDWAAGDEAVRKAAGAAGVVRPQFEAGDLVLFDHMLMHKTAVTPDMTRERHAIETWCFGASAYPERHIPIVW